jgi:hypothetical protein
LEFTNTFCRTCPLKAECGSSRSRFLLFDEEEGERSKKRNGVELNVLVFITKPITTSKEIV